VSAKDVSKLHCPTSDLVLQNEVHRCPVEVVSHGWRLRDVRMRLATRGTSGHTGAIATWLLIVIIVIVAIVVFLLFIGVCALLCCLEIITCCC
jgi:hypothetical protein